MDKDIQDKIDEVEKEQTLKHGRHRVMITNLTALTATLMFGRDLPRDAMLLVADVNKKAVEQLFMDRAALEHYKKLAIDDVAEKALLGTYEYDKGGKEKS